MGRSLGRTGGNWDILWRGYWDILGYTGKDILGVTGIYTGRKEHHWYILGELGYAGVYTGVYIRIYTGI